MSTDEFVIPNDPNDLWSEDSDLPLKIADASIELDDQTSIRTSEEIAYTLCGENPLCVCEQRTFDLLAHVVKRWPSLPAQTRVQLVDAMATSMVCLSAWIDNVLSLPLDCEERNVLVHYRSAFKVYVFFMQWISRLAMREATSVPASGAAAMGGKGRGKKRSQQEGWSWAEQAVKIVKSVGQMASVDLWAVFRPARPDDSVLVSLTQLSVNCLSFPGCEKDGELVKHAGHVFGLMALKYQHLDSVSAALVDLITQFEHTPAAIAEIVRYSVAEWDDVRLASAILHDLSSVDPAEYERQQNATGEKAGVRSVATFVEEMSDMLPRLMVSQISLLLPHLGGKAWTLRSSIIISLGHLLAKAFESSDLKEDQAAVLNRLRSKQHLLDILCERVRDQSSYTRKAVLQTWQNLAEQRAIPLGHWLVVTGIATGRLEDKSSLVRKEAMRLIGCLMLHNPFGPSLPLDRFSASLKHHSQMLDEVMPSVEVPNQENDIKENQDGNKESHIKGSAVKTEPETDHHEEPQVQVGHVVNGKTPEEVGWDGTVEELQALVASLELAVDFSKSLTACMPHLVNLLASSTTSDVQESISLLLTCKQFEIVGAPEAIRKMLTLIFARDQAVKDRVVEALDQLYLSGWAGNSFTSSQAAQNLINLAKGATLGELGSLEEAIQCFSHKGLITAVTVHELWDLASNRSDELKDPNHGCKALKQLRGAIAVISMSVNVIPDTMTESRVRNLLAIAFGRARYDALTVRHACVALGKISAKELLESKYDNVRKDVYVALVRTLIASDIPDKAWFTVAEAAISSLYQLHPDPDSVSSAIVRKLTKDAFDGRDADDNPPPSRLAAKLFFAVGEIALRHLVLIENRTKDVRKARLDAERRAAEANNSGKKEEDINSELGVGGVAADAELDATKEAAEKQIIGYEGSVLHQISKIILKTCHHSSFLTAEPTLKSSALLALTKLMVVDPRICEQSLQLIFTLLQNRAVDAAIRSNLVIALGDLALRFPNILEPWTEHVYRPLGDPDVGVRKTAMMVLTHLILNDMMKVKGHIAKMAACLEDPDDRVASLASLFFHELAKKEYKGTSPIYNLLPDMLSVLSRDTSLNRSQFQSVMQQLLSHIKKDRQGDALIEKLCQRFAATEDVVQWRNVAFCIGQLPMSEKGIKKLLEGFPCFKAALADEETADIMLNIVNKAKKSASKPESKEIAEDLESKMTTFIEECKEEEAGPNPSPEVDETVLQEMNSLRLQDDSACDTYESDGKKEGYAMTPLSGQKIAVKDELKEDEVLISAVKALTVD